MKSEKKKFKATKQCINSKDGHSLTEPDVFYGMNSYGTSHLASLATMKITREQTLELAPRYMESEPRLSEVESAIKDIKRCKICKTCQWSTDWKLQEFYMFKKRGDVKDCNNYRTIALISHASKILLIIILNRLKLKVKEELCDCQAAYRKNRET